MAGVRRRHARDDRHAEHRRGSRRSRSDDNNVDTPDGCTTCVPATCGDGYTWNGVEECDDANPDDTDACLNSCVAATCGDGIVWAGNEECDDQNVDGTDACTSICSIAGCGDGFVWAGNEECDDQNVTAHDGCEPDCTDTTLVQLAIGNRHSCARFDDGAVRCWGQSHGLGNEAAEHVGDNPGEMPPVDTNFGTGSVIKLVTGVYSTCVLLDDGAVRCWGSGYEGKRLSQQEFTIGDEPGEMPTPALQLGLPIVDIAMTYHSCVVRTDGAVLCWGPYGAGKLGYGGGGPNSGFGDAPGEITPPATNLGPVPVWHVALSHEHSCAIHDDMTVRCWGWNLDGQLGLGHTNAIGDSPLEMPPELVPVF